MAAARDEADGTARTSDAGLRTARDEAETRKARERVLFFIRRDRRTAGTTTKAMTPMTPAMAAAAIIPPTTVPASTEPVSASIAKGVLDALTRATDGEADTGVALADKGVLVCDAETPFVRLAVGAADGVSEGVGASSWQQPCAVYVVV